MQCPDHGMVRARRGFECRDVVRFRWVTGRVRGGIGCRRRLRVMGVLVWFWGDLKNRQLRVEAMMSVSASRDAAFHAIRLRGREMRMLGRRLILCRICRSSEWVGGGWLRGGRRGELLGWWV